MPDFDVEAFIAKLDRMGMKLTAVALADGKLRVNRWCMLNAAEHAQQIRDLWTTQIGNDRERIDVLAAHWPTQRPGRPSTASARAHCKSVHCKSVRNRWRRAILPLGHMPRLIRAAPPARMSVPPRTRRREFKWRRAFRPLRPRLQARLRNRAMKDCRHQF